MLSGSPVNVVDFGAVGDGTTDDTTAFRNAVAYALTNSIGLVIVPSTNAGYKITDTVTCSNGTSAVRIAGNQTETTQIWSYVTGTTPVFLFQGSPTGYYGAGVQSLTLIAKNAAANYAARNSGSAIKLSGTIGVSLTGLFIQDYTYGVWLYNTTNLWTELTKLDLHLQYCSNGIRMETANVTWPSFRDTSGYVYADIQTGQIGIAVTANVLWYNSVFTMDWTSQGAGSPQIINVDTAIVQDNTIVLNGEVQGTSTPALSIAASARFKSQTFVATNGTLTGLPSGPGYGQILNTGRSYLTSKTVEALAANAATTVLNINGAMVVIREGTVGGSALLLVDAAGGGTVTVVSDPFSRIATSDPGAGTSKLWVSFSGTTLTVTNRYAAAQQIDLAILGAN